MMELCRIRLCCGPFPVLVLATWILVESMGGIETAGAETRWLPPDPLYPRSVSDPMEPRLGLQYAPAPEQLDAALGAPIPLVQVLLGPVPIMAVLEGAAFLRLGRDGSFFPLRTVDGTFGLGFETRRDRLFGRLRLVHWSAHTADGDSSVTFPGKTFSREFWQLETGYRLPYMFLYARIGSAWHAVPESRGMVAALGGVWKLGDRTARPLVAVHLSAEAERSWRVTQTFFCGMEFGGENTLRAGVRGFRGNSVRGQDRESVERYFGIELQFCP